MQDDAAAPSHAPHRADCPCGDGTRPGHPLGWCGQGSWAAPSQEHGVELEALAAKLVKQWRKDARSVSPFAARSDYRRRQTLLQCAKELSHALKRRDHAG